MFKHHILSLKSNVRIYNLMFSIRKIARNFTGSIKKVGRKIGGMFNKLGQTKLLQRGLVKSMDDFTNTEKLHIAIAKASYKQPRPEILNGYQYRDSFSDIETAIYYSPMTRHLIVGFRGTAGLKDVVTDIAIAKHKEAETQRYRKALETYDRAVRMLNPDKTTITGHSLGGNIALYVNSQRKVNYVYAVNPAINLTNVAQSWAGAKNVLIIRTSSDSVSTLTGLSGFNVKTLPIDGNDILASHSIDTFGV